MCLPLPLLWASRPSRSVSPSAMSAQGVCTIAAIALWRASPPPLFALTLLLPTVVCPHRLPPTLGLQHLQLTLGSVLRPSKLRRHHLRCRCPKMTAMMCACAGQCAITYLALVIISRMKILARHGGAYL